MTLKKFFTGRVFLFIVLFPVYARGLFQLLFGNKIVPYAVQFAAVVAFVIAVLYCVRVTAKGFRQFFLLSYLLFFIAMAVSIGLTGVRFQIFGEALLFSSIILFLFTVFSLFNLTEPLDEKFRDGIVFLLAIIAWILFLASIFEQIIFLIYGIKSSLNPFIFPGHSYFIWSVRPASLTGSMLHYPIIMPLLGAVSARFGKDRFMKISGWIFLLSPFLTFSRSGMVLSLIIIFLYGAYKIFCWFRDSIRSGRIRKNLKTAAIVTSIVAVLFSLSLLAFEGERKFFATLADRVFAIRDTGNNSRLNTWGAIFRSFLDSNILFGEFAGTRTNIVRNILGKSGVANSLASGASVTESGFLEIMISFGLLGALFYYSIFILSIIRLLFGKKEHLLAFAMTGVMIQTFFYQSVEVLPFMFTAALLPLLASGKSPEKK